MWYQREFCVSNIVLSIDSTEYKFQMITFDCITLNTICDLTEFCGISICCITIKMTHSDAFYVRKSAKWK